MILLEFDYYELSRKARETGQPHLNGFLRKRSCIEHLEAERRTAREELPRIKLSKSKRSSEIMGMLVTPKDVISIGQFFCLWSFLDKINF